MKASIKVEVESKEHAKAIEWALADPEVCGFVIVVGTLLPFSPQARARVLTFVQNKLTEEREMVKKKL